ncbi:MAG: hypothetical protein NTX45_24205, partial [Proteobacteria bacterium]|nr:hypothetical protein [Pseudomonadota bacterium]
MLKQQDINVASLREKKIPAPQLHSQIITLNATTPPNIRILLLEDVPTDAELIEAELRDAGLSFTSKVVQTKREFTDALK